MNPVAHAKIHPSVTFSKNAPHLVSSCYETILQLFNRHSFFDLTIVGGGVHWLCRPLNSFSVPDPSRSWQAKTCPLTHPMTQHREGRTIRQETFSWKGIGVLSSNTFCKWHFKNKTKHSFVRDYKRAVAVFALVSLVSKWQTKAPGLFLK